MSMRIAALASGTGSNVQAMLDAIAEGRLGAEMAVVISNRTDAPVLRMARDRGVAVWARNHKEYAGREAFDQALLCVVREHGADVVALAGYMRLLSPLFIRTCGVPVLNVHPALLPSFPGLRGTADALAHGVRIAGVTVHFVDEIMDHGPIIIQAAAPVSGQKTEESLMPRIHAMEHRIYPQALAWLAQGRLALTDRQVHLAPAQEPCAGQTMVHDGPHGPWLVSPGLEI